jgi:hypothetical protein
MEVVTFGEGRTALRFGQQKINLGRLRSASPAASGPVSFFRFP